MILNIIARENLVDYIMKDFSSFLSDFADLQIYYLLINRCSIK